MYFVHFPVVCYISSLYNLKKKFWKKQWETTERLIEVNDMIQFMF